MLKKFLRDQFSQQLFLLPKKCLNAMLWNSSFSVVVRGFRWMFPPLQREGLSQRIWRQKKMPVLWKDYTMILTEFI